MIRIFRGRANDGLTRIGLGRVTACAALLGVGVAAGVTLPTAGTAQGEVQSAGQPQHFQSGGQLAVPVLKEIAATLHQIDARLARLETLGQQLRPTKPKKLPEIPR